MSGRSLGVMITGGVVFIVMDAFITNVITGTDTGSVILQTVLLLVLAAVIIVGVVKML